MCVYVGLSMDWSFCTSGVQRSNPRALLYRIADWMRYSLQSRLMHDSELVQ